MENDNHVSTGLYQTSNSNKPIKRNDFGQGSKTQKTISAIVPVYNEDKTVAKVVETLLNNPLINEVICVNDGSTDKSLTILKKIWR